MKHHYQHLLKRILILSGLVGFPFLMPAHGEDASTLGRQQFQEIASKLDLGGDLLLVANTDSIVDQFMATAIAGNGGDAAESPDEKDIRETLERFRSFLNRNGFSAVHGIGLSLAPAKGDQHAAKLFISRDFAASRLPLWRGVVGWHPRRMLSLDFVPADIAMTRAGTPEFSSLWQVFLSAIDEVAPEATRKRFETWHRGFSETLGLELEDIIKSLRDEALIAVRLSETAQSVVPTPNGLVSIPEPSFLIVVGTNDDMLRGLIEAQFSKRNLPLTETRVGDIIMRSTTRKLPSLFPLQPAYASQAGYFILGSNPDIVSEALLAYRHKNGLVSRPAFRDAFQGLSMVNNGLLFVSPSMGKALGPLHEAHVNQTVALSGNHPAAARLLKTLMTYGGKTPSCALTLQNWKTGVMVMGHTAWGGKDVMTRLTAAPMQLLLSLFDKTSHVPRRFPAPVTTASEETSDAEAPSTE